MNELPEGAIHLIDGASGIYIPQYFAENMDRSRIEGVSDEQWAILEAGPDHEWYWETWEEVESSAVVVGEYTLYQDGDLWLIPLDAEWPE